MTNEIPSLRFWALTLQQLYSEHHEEIMLSSYIPKVYCTFKAIQTFRFLNQSSFGPVRRLPQHMLDVIPSDSLIKKFHLETLVLADLLNTTSIVDEQPSKVNRPTTSGFRQKKIAKKRK